MRSSDKTFNLLPHRNRYARADAKCCMNLYSLFLCSGLLFFPIFYGIFHVKKINYATMHEKDYKLLNIYQLKLYMAIL